MKLQTTCFVFCVAGGLSLLTPVLAFSSPRATPSASQEYSLSDLRTRPAVLEVFKDGLHTVEFPTPIEKVFGPSTGLLQLQTSGNLLLITGLAANGQPPFLVKLTDGSTAMFEARLLPARAGSNRYTVISSPSSVQAGFASPRAVTAPPPVQVRPVISAAALPALPPIPRPARGPQGYVHLGAGYGLPKGQKGGLSYRGVVGTRDLGLGIGARAGVGYHPESERVTLEGALVKHFDNAYLGLGGGISLSPSGKGKTQTHVNAPFGLELNSGDVGAVFEVAPEYDLDTGELGVQLRAGLSLKF